jgi:flagellar assembly factor FliW
MSTTATALAVKTLPEEAMLPRTAVETRFGTFVFDATNTLFMPSGPLGFAALRHFGLANLPDPKLSAFKLLQSLDDADVSFVLTPLELHPGLIAPEDVASGATAVGFDRSALEPMLIVTVRAVPGGAELSANLRAPLLVDLDRRMARQVVLGNPDLPVRHAIGTPA